jgi:zinc D-Ala-D-Ala carboxypeptidase|tara:strand:+ start:213 stop:665 length:453 start_codon:yes stop_codon:yes gene_type:complete
VNLSEHFTLGEMTKSQTALRLGIDNDPDEDAVENLTLVCESILEPVREYYDIPFSPSSAYRCPELNRNVGSANTSQHISGEAIDFEIPGVPNMGLAQWIMDNLDYDQLILEFYKEGEPNSGWVHCSYCGEGNRNDAKRFDGTQWVPLGEN